MEHRQRGARLLALTLLLTLLLSTVGAVTAAAPSSHKNGTLVMATCSDFPPYEYKEGDTVVGEIGRAHV